MLSSDDLSTVLAHWDLDSILSVDAFATTEYRSSGRVIFIKTRAGQYVLKRMDDRLLTAETYSALANSLYAQGVPVAAPVLTRAGTPTVRQGKENYFLLPYLPGEVITEHFGTHAEARAWQFGKAIAELHRGLKACEDLVTVQEMDLPGEVAAGSQVIRERGGEGAESIEKVLAELNLDIIQIYADLPIQLIHRDAHSANFLFQDEQVSGWLDFELTRRGPRLFDLCYCATSLLMNGMEDPGRRVQWLALLDQLVKGYTSVSPLTDAERSALWYMLLSIEVIFAAFFIEMNDETGVIQNLDALLWMDQQRHQINRVVAAIG